MVMQTYKSNQPGTIREQVTRVFERNRPQQIAGGEKYEICINKIITHIIAGLESYTGTNHD